MRARVSNRWVAALLVAGVALWAGGCSEDKLSDEERAAIFHVFEAGVNLNDDPFARAETLRVLELVADPTFNHFVEPLVDDRVAKVRVAALRVLLKTKHDKAQDLTLARFSRAGVQEKSALYTAALEYVDAEPFHRTLQGWAMRTDDPRLRMRAFQHGYLARVDEALAGENTKLLEQMLVPELSAFVDHEDDRIAAAALAKLFEVGDKDRAQQLIATFENERAPIADRLAAARKLIGARVSAAQPAYLAVLARDAIGDSNALGLPQQRVNPELVRAATLGAASNDNKYVAKAQAYLKDANEQHTIEVLEALSANPSSEAAVSLRIAMRDARMPVRRRAVELYGARSDARADALIGVTRHDDHETQRMLAGLLADRFKDDWSAHLEQRLKNEQFVDQTLVFMRNVLRSREELAVMQPLEKTLQTLASDAEQAERASISAYLLARISDQGEHRHLLDDQPDIATRYAYLEHLVNNDPKAHVATFRRHFHEDLFAMRLISAAGLWRAFEQ